MAKLRLAGVARATIRRILSDSEREHGAIGRLRYAELIEAALGDLAEDPLRPSARRIVIDGRTLLTYHLALAKHRVADPPGRVRPPRHTIVYEVSGDGAVDVYGLVHERMEPGRALRRLRAASLAERDSRR